MLGGSRSSVLSQDEEPFVFEPYSPSFEESVDWNSLNLMRLCNKFFSYLLFIFKEVDLVILMVAGGPDSACQRA